MRGRRAASGVRVAPQTTFRAAGMGSILCCLPLKLGRRPDGRLPPTLEPESACQRTVFGLDSRVQWANGRLVRDYTLLLDPP